MLYIPIPIVNPAMPIAEIVSPKGSGPSAVVTPTPPMKNDEYFFRVLPKISNTSEMFFPILSVLLIIYYISGILFSNIHS